MGHFVIRQKTSSMFLSFMTQPTRLCYQMISNFKKNIIPEDNWEGNKKGLTEIDGRIRQTSKLTKRKILRKRLKIGQHYKSHNVYFPKWYKLQNISFNPFPRRHSRKNSKTYGFLAPKKCILSPHQSYLLKPYTSPQDIENYEQASVI